MGKEYMIFTKFLHPGPEFLTPFYALFDTLYSELLGSGVEHCFIAESYIVSRRLL